MANLLSSETIARLKDRAGSADRRSVAEEVSANSTSFGDMLGASRDELAGQPDDVRDGVRDYLKGMNTPFAGMIADSAVGDGGKAKGLFGALGSLLGRPMVASGPGGLMSIGPKRKPKAAPPPATKAEIAAAEAKLGFVLPDDLRQFYLEVADGGVGPGNGLYSLKQLLSKWQELTNEPIGPRGQKWPARLLPIEGDDWDLTSIDRDSGKLVYWDVEDIDDGWTQSFKDEAESLESWLAKWLAKPSLEEKAKRRAERPEPRQLSDEDWDVWAQESADNQEYMRRMNIATMSPEERAAIGLTEDNWVEKMWEGVDLGKIRPPTPGYAERKRRRDAEAGD